MLPYSVVLNQVCLVPGKVQKGERGGEKKRVSLKESTLANPKNGTEEKKRGEKKKCLEKGKNGVRVRTCSLPHCSALSFIVLGRRREGEGGSGKEKRRRSVSNIVEKNTCRDERKKRAAKYNVQGLLSLHLSTKSSRRKEKK